MSKIQSMIETFQAINEVRKIKHDKNIQDKQEKLKTKTLEKLAKELEKLEEKKFFNHKTTSVNFEQEVKTEITQTKEKIEQKAFRYFLKDESMKGVQSAQITKLAGKKPTWIRAGKNADKDWYVSAIGTKSDDVEKYMMMLPNMTEKGNKYFNRSEWKAKYWRGQK